MINLDEILLSDEGQEIQYPSLISTAQEFFQKVLQFQKSLDEKIAVIPVQDFARVLDVSITDFKDKKILTVGKLLSKCIGAIRLKDFTFDEAMGLIEIKAKMKDGKELSLSEKEKKLLLRILQKHENIDIPTDSLLYVMNLINNENESEKDDK